MLGLDNKVIIIIGVGIAIFLAFLVMYADLQYQKSQKYKYQSQVSELTSKIQIQNAAVNQLAKETEAYKKKAADAEKKSTQITAEYMVKIDSFDKEKVSTNCNQSIMWAIEKAKEL